MITTCTRARARAFQHKREVGRQSVRSGNKILNDLRNPSDIFLTYTWICMGLDSSMGLDGSMGQDGSTCSECLLVVTFDLGPPEHAPRASAKALTCAVVFGRASFVPRRREHEKRPAAAREQMSMCKKDTFIHNCSDIYEDSEILQGIFLIGGGVTQKQKKRNFQGLRRHFRCRPLKVFEFWLTFYFLSHKVPSAATAPRALQLKPRRENRRVRTILSRAIEGIEWRGLCPFGNRRRRNPLFVWTRNNLGLFFALVGVHHTVVGGLLLTRAAR